MTISVGNRVRILPLGGKRGRVVGAPSSEKSRGVLYLVRYEVGEDEPDRRSETALFVDNELVNLSVDKKRHGKRAKAKGGDDPADASHDPV